GPRSRHPGAPLLQHTGAASASRRPRPGARSTVQPTTNREAEARTAKVCRDQRRIAVNITCATVGLGTLRAGYAAPGWTPGGLEPTPKRQTGRSEPST